MKKITTDNKKFQLMKERVTSLTNSDLTKILGGNDSAIVPGHKDSLNAAGKDSLPAAKPARMDSL
jgi:hypothetical protein